MPCDSDIGSKPKGKLLLRIELPFAVASRNKVERMHWARRHQYRDMIAACVSDLLSTRSDPSMSTIPKRSQSWTHWWRMEFSRVTRLKKYLSSSSRAKSAKRSKRKGR